MFVGYRHFDRAAIEPRFPFGHGLDYTTFRYENLSVHTSGDSVRVAFDLQNTGERPGAEIVQVYVSRPHAPPPRAVRELKAFRKFTLNAGARQSVSFVLPRDVFASYDAERRAWTVHPGPAEIQVASSSRQTRGSLQTEVR
jgi:beta-glucosidase